MVKTHISNNDEKDWELCRPDPKRIVEGLRDTGYNFNTAIADIVDNSISANATNVDIRIDMAPNGEISVYITDNGVGMDQAGLVNAMTYGSKARENTASLGKFGLGLKTASTAFCRSLSVISRSQDDTIVRKAQWDLDYIANEHEWKLKKPEVTKDELQLLEATANGKSGTLVVWEKIDRLLKAYGNLGNRQSALKKKINELEFHIAMVYQRFLDKNDDRASNVEILLNGTNIVAWDPFVKNETKTEMLAEREIDVEMPDGSVPYFSLKAYMIPRGDDFSTTKAKETAKISNDMQGFYVYRENRLIHYGDWLGMFSKEPHLSLLRVEFSFSHELDIAFNVDIKKSRILPAEEIVDYIKSKFMPAPRRAAEERYRIGAAKIVATKSGEYDAHAASNRNIDEKAKSVEEAKITVTKSDEVKVENQHGTFSHKITIVSGSKPGQVRLIPKEILESGQLWEPCIADGKHAVLLNQSHPYYQKVYYPILTQNVMVTGMDALLWALAEAEHATYNEETREHYEDMRIHVSRILKKLVADLPDPETGDDIE
jgi:hypothetical protein